MSNITFGVIGSGNIGKAVASHLAKAGFSVTIGNSRGPESLAGLVKELGGNTRAGTAKDAANQDIVILAMPWKDVPHTMPGLTDWSKRIVVDATNHFISVDPFTLADLGGGTSSEVVAQHVQGAKLIKAFNTLHFEILGANPEQAGGRRVLFLAGDDSSAKHELKEAMKKMGFAPIDLGGLVAGGKLMQPDGPVSSQNLVKLP